MSIFSGYLEQNRYSGKRATERWRLAHLVGLFDPYLRFTFDVYNISNPLAAWVGLFYLYLWFLLDVYKISQALAAPLLFDVYKISQALAARESAMWALWRFSNLRWFWSNVTRWLLTAERWRLAHLVGLFDPYLWFLFDVKWAQNDKSRLKKS